MTEEITLLDNLNDIKVAEPADLVLDFEYTPADIKIKGKDEIESVLQDYVKKYDNYVVTSESFEDDKKVVTRLNKLEKSIKTIVKEKLADYSKPLDEIKVWLDGLIEPIYSVKASIDKGVKEFEELERQKRVATIKETFEEVIESTGEDVDIRLFSEYFDELSKKSCFMADNVRVSKATKEIIVSLVADELDKRWKREEALVKITEAAAKADFGPAVYISQFERGAELADILQAIADDKIIADSIRAEEARKAELSKRISEISVIAKNKGLDPNKYIKLLESGQTSLSVHEILISDAKEFEKQNELAEIAKRNNVTRQERQETTNDTPDSQSGVEDKIEPKKVVVKWQGDFKITFPDSETAKLFGAKGGLYEQHGVVVQKLGEWVKI